MIRGLLVFFWRVGGGGDIDMIEVKGESDLILAVGSTAMSVVSGSAETGV